MWEMCKNVIGMGGGYALFIYCLGRITYRAVTLTEKEFKRKEDANFQIGAAIGKGFAETSGMYNKENK